MNSSDFGLEFPQSLQIRTDLFDTLKRLSIYKPEPTWEDRIMEAYYKSMSNFGVPSKIMVDPRTFNNLKDQLK